MFCYLIVFLFFILCGGSGGGCLCCVLRVGLGRLSGPETLTPRRGLFLVFLTVDTPGWELRGCFK